MSPEVALGIAVLVSIVVLIAFIALAAIIFVMFKEVGMAQNTLYKVQLRLVSIEQGVDRLVKETIED